MHFAGSAPECPHAFSPSLEKAAGDSLVFYLLEVSCSTKTFSFESSARLEVVNYPREVLSIRRKDS